MIAKLERNKDSVIDVLFVGAFPPPNRKIFGGNVTVCRLLMESDFPRLVNVIPIDSTQRSNPPPTLLFRSIFAIRRMFIFTVSLLRHQPHVVLLFCSPGFSLLEKGAMGWMSRLAGSKVLLFPRGGRIVDDFARSVFNRLWIGFSLRSAHRVLCQGANWHKFCVNQLGLSTDRAPIVPNWSASCEHVQVGRERFMSQQNRKRRVKQLLFVGWVERTKGVFELVNVFSTLLERYDMELSIAGHGNAEQTLRRIVKELGIDGHVVFHGWKTPDELLELYRDADVFVLPSWFEGLPNALIEAMACGLPSVVTNVGNISDAVEHLQTGILVEPRNEGELFNAIDMLVSDEPLERALGLAAMQKAETTYSLPSAVSILMRQIQDLT